ncbi:hypothetical protein PTMSG1_03343 [Pyrenophora teres f. maculata]|nr:hypothetical protein PTMSG1_03343 [Pyrenophora teres f. maculata]
MSACKWLIDNLIEAFRTFAHITAVLLTDPIVSHLPLGGWTSVFSIAVASFLSSQPKVSIGGGLATFNSELSALLACVVLSTAFADVLVILLRVLYREAFLDTRVIQPALTGLLTTLAANLQYLFGAGSHIPHLDAILQAFQSLTAALKSKWSLYSVRDSAEYLLNDVQGITKVDDERDGKEPKMPRGRGVAQGTSSKLSPMEQDPKDYRKLSREGWELVEKAGEAKNGANNFTNDEKRQEALLDEVFRLIDQCKERKDVDWDGAIAVLENGQKDGRLVEK